MGEFNGKCVIATGAASAFGAVIAGKFAGAGAGGLVADFGRRRNLDR